MWRRFGRLLWPVIGLCVLVSACSRRGQEPASTRPDTGAAARSGKVVRIGMLPKLIGIPYFNACRAGAEEAARELGVELLYDGPLTADSGRQQEIVNSWIHRRLDAIAVAPNNPEAIAPVLEKARAQGLHVLTWDTDSVPSARALFCNQTGYEAMARTLVDITAAEIGGAGRVALISGTETAANQNTWMAMMRAYAKEKYPQLVWVDPVEYPGEDDARAYQSAQGLLRRSERPNAIIGMTTVSAPAAAKAVFDAKLSGEVAVTGITLPGMIRAYVKNGTVKKFVLWDPVDFGYLTVCAAKRLVDGAVGQELDCGRLGKKAVNGSEIVLGGPLVFDSSTVDDYDF